MNLNKIYNSIFILIFVFTFFIPKSCKTQTNDTIINNIQSIDSYLNHANTHFRLGRYWKNALQEFQIANKYIDSAEKILKTSKLDTFSLKAFSLRILNFRNEITEIEGICVDNMNGRFPLYMSLMWEIDNFEFIDDPLEIACENAIDKLLNLNTIKPSKPLSELMVYSVVELKPYDATIEEVCAQYINNNSNSYVISRHELGQILNEDKTSFSDEDYKKIGNFYGVNSIGKYTVKINDQVDNINYATATFDYFNPNSGQVISYTIAEGLIVDKIGVTLNAIFKGALLYVFLFLGITFLFNFLFFRVYVEKKWPSLKNSIASILSTIFGVVIALVSSLCLFLLVDLYSPSPDDFFGSLQSKLWIISTPLVLGCLSPLISILLAGLILKKKILGEKPLIIAFLQGAFMGSMSILLLHYYLSNEVQSSLNTFLIFSLFAVISSVLSGLSYFSYETNPSSKKYLTFSVLYTFPIVFLHLFLIKNQDSIFLIQFSYVLISFLPILLIEKFWTSIINFFKANKNNALSQIPGKIGELDKVLNATLSYEKNAPRINFNEAVKNDLINAVKQTYDQPHLGFLPESNKINVLYIRGPRGIGKTTLLEKELGSAYDNHYFYGDCDEFQDGNTIPYEPFVQAFGHVVGEGVFLSGDRHAKMVVEKLKPGIEETPIGSLALSMINTNSFAGASIKEICKVFEAFITQMVSSQVTRKPFIFVLEDIHWMDEETYDLLLEFLKMIRILKKRMKFDFILIITERISKEEPRLKEKYEEFLTGIRSEQNYNFTDLFSVSEDGPFLVDDDFCDKFLLNCNVDINFKTRQKIANGFKNLGFNNPGHILESLKYIISNNWFKEENGLLVLKQEADFKNIPLPSQLKEMFAEKFSMLDEELKRILETASFIGETFEANILSDIWKIDRLKLLHKLREAEEHGFVKDVSEKDDVYKFSNKSIIAELRRYASKGLKNDRRPQIVKEYHKMITNIMLYKKEIDPNTFDINIVSQLADRTFFNRDQMPDEAFKLNYITAKRSLDKVNTKHANEYIKRLKVLIEDDNVSLINRIKTLVLKQKVYLVDLSSGNFKAAISNAENIESLIKKLPLDDLATKNLYEQYFIDQLQLHYQTIAYFNIDEFRNQKQNHLDKIEYLCMEKNSLMDSEKIYFSQKFYSFETFLFGQLDKKIEKLEELKIEIEKSSQNHSKILGRVYNSLAICYNNEDSKSLWTKRLVLVLEDSNIEITDSSELSIFKLISKNYSSLLFDSKKDVLYTTGAYSRFVFTSEKNYELALDLSNTVKNMNLIAGDYRGLSTASSFISMSYNELYKKSKDQELFDKAFYFNEEVYYELEGGYIIENGKGNPADSISQFIVLVNWIQLLSLNSNIGDTMKKSLSNAVNDFIMIFQNDTGKISIVESYAIKDYIQIFQTLSDSPLLVDIEVLIPLFEKVEINK